MNHCYQTRCYHIFSENNPKCYNESSNRIQKLKFRVILNDVCKNVAASGAGPNNLVTQYPNYSIRNYAFHSANGGCNLIK
jgi:hypothetical protein